MHFCDVLANLFSHTSHNLLKFSRTINCYYDSLQSMRYGAIVEYTIDAAITEAD